jgi:hypothetical protein
MALPNDLSNIGSIANAVYNSIAANTTAITTITIGNTTANAVVNTTGFAVGNTTVNTAINTTTFTVANSTVNAVVNTTGFAVGNTTANAVINSIAFTVANSTVSYSYAAPTAAQKANTTFFLNANGSWAAPASTGGANTTITSSSTLTSSSLKIVSVAMANVGQSVTLPAATTLTTGGPIFALVNKNSNIEFGIRDASGALIAAVGPNGDGECYLEDNSTTAGTWSVRGSNLLPAIRSLEYIFGSTYRAKSGYNGSNGTVDAIIRLSDTLSVGIVRSTTGQPYVFAIDHSTYPDTIGTPVLVNASVVSNLGLFKITATKAALTFNISSTAYIYNIAISGATSTVSTAATTTTILFPSSSTIKFNNFGVSTVAIVGTNRDVLVFVGVNGASTYAQAFNCSGTNPIAGTAVDISSSASGSSSYLGELSSTKALCVIYVSAQTTFYYQILTISGTTITFGTSVSGGPGGAVFESGATAYQLSSNSFITYRLYNDDTDYHHYIKSFQISGSTITPNSSIDTTGDSQGQYLPIFPYFTGYSNTLFSIDYTRSLYNFIGVFSCVNGGTISNTNLGFLRSDYIAGNQPSYYAYRSEALSNNSFLYVTDSSGLNSNYGGNKMLTEINISGNTFSNGNIWLFPGSIKPVSGFTSFGNNGLTIYRSMSASSNNTVTDYSFSAFRYTTANGIRFLGSNSITLPNLTQVNSNTQTIFGLGGITDGYTTSNGSNKFTIAGSTNLIGIAPANTTYANSALRNTPIINVLEFIV